ncbi:MAG: hypothetical protein MPW17_15625 [Candidatus Manganitrophus sp.]|nr:MAG: hypothetical protein MPW17_15625 [Candidatus Manganitrophus sp.]
MAGDPADIGGAPVSVGLFQIEYPAGGDGDTQKIAGRRMDDPLRLAGRPAGVENEEGMLRVERLGAALIGGGFHQIMPPKIAIGLHLDRGVGPPDDNDPLDPRGFLQRLVDLFFQGDDLPFSVAAVGRHDQPGFGIVDPVPQGGGRKAAENNRMGGADPGAGEHGDRQLRDHRHVDRHAISFDDPLSFQDIGELANLPMEILVGQDARVARLPFPDDRRLVFPPALQVTVEAIVGDIDLAADKPLGEGGFHSKTFFHGLNQESSLASPAQKASGFFSAFR